jgi:hypothetical protein
MKKLVLASLLLALGLSAGCNRAYTVTVSPQASQSTNYVIVRTGKGGSEKVFDCRSYPDGQTYDPTCVRVKIK